jgi:hypothetical protein
MYSCKAGPGCENYQYNHAEIQKIENEITSEVFHEGTAEFFKAYGLYCKNDY